MGKNDIPASFAALIEEAQKAPERQVLRGADLSSPFSTPLPPEHRVVDDDPRQIAGVPEFDYRAHVKFLTLPNDAGDYEEILNEALAGKCIIRSENTTFTKEGDCNVVVIYLTKLERPRRAQRRRDEDAFPR